MAVRSHISGSRLLLNGLSPQPISTDQSIRTQLPCITLIGILIIYEWLQTSVQTCKRTNVQTYKWTGQLKKKVSKNRSNDFSIKLLFGLAEKAFGQMTIYQTKFMK
jgi:hypothetical protein